MRSTTAKLYKCRFQGISLADAQRAADLLGDDHSAQFVNASYDAGRSHMDLSLKSSHAWVFSGLPIVRSRGGNMQLCAGGFWEKASSMVLIAQYAAGVYEAHTGYFCVADSPDALA